MKVARYYDSFSGSIPLNFENNYVAIDKHLQNCYIVLLDKDENLS